MRLSGEERQTADPISLFDRLKESMSNIDRMRDEQLKNEKAEAEGSSFFYRQTRSRNWLSSLNYGKI